MRQAAGRPSVNILGMVQAIVTRLDIAKKVFNAGGQITRTSRSEGGHNEVVRYLM